MLCLAIDIFIHVVTPTLFFCFLLETFLMKRVCRIFCFLLMTSQIANGLLICFPFPVFLKINVAPRCCIPVFLYCKNSIFATLRSGTLKFGVVDLYGLEEFFMLYLLCVYKFIFGGSCISSLADNNYLCSLYICNSLLLFSDVNRIRLSEACLHTLVMPVNNSSVLSPASDGTSD